MICVRIRSFSCQRSRLLRSVSERQLLTQDGCRVGRWRGGTGFGIVLCQGFPLGASIAACHTPFPLSRSSNRTCEFPASGFPTNICNLTMRNWFKVVLSVCTFALFLSHADTANADDYCFQPCQPSYVVVYQPQVWWITSSDLGACCYLDPETGQYSCRQDTENGCTICWGPKTTCTWNRGLSCSDACPNDFIHRSW